MELAAEVEAPVARRNDVSIKLDAEVARMAKLVADFEDKALAAYLSDLIRPLVEKDLERHAEKFLARKKPKPKGGAG